MLDALPNCSLARARATVAACHLRVQHACAVFTAPRLPVKSRQTQPALSQSSDLHGPTHRGSCISSWLRYVDLSAWMRPCITTISHGIVIITLRIAHYLFIAYSCRMGSIQSRRGRKDPFMYCLCKAKEGLGTSIQI